MTYSAENISQAFKFAAATELRMAVAALLARIVRERRVHKTVRILSALDDSALHDIGLERDRILWAARHAALAAEHRITR